MSKSIHITTKNLKGLTKNEVNDQFKDPDSDLAQWSKKSMLKKTVRTKRKNQNNENISKK
jgi:hypothetical protein